MKSFKKFLAIALTVVMLVSCIPTVGIMVNAAEDSSSNVYDAVSYFAADTGHANNGIWRYQSRRIVGGKYVYEDMTYSSSIWESENGAASIKSATGDLVIDNSVQVMALNSNNQTVEPVLTFVAPKSGNICIRMSNKAVLAPGSGNGTDLARFAFLCNDDTIINVEGLDEDNNTKGNRVFAEPIYFPVKKGEVLRFAVGRNKNVGLPYGVRFNPVIEYTNVETLPTYNAYNEYSTAGNPNGVWGYQYFDGTTYTNLTTDGTRWGSDAEGKIQQGKDNIYSGKDAIYVYAAKGTKDMVLVFNAPYSGKINISMPNIGVIAPSSNQGKGLTFSLKQNDTVIRKKTDLDSTTNPIATRYFMDTVNLTVKKDDKIRFVIHQNTGANDPRVYFNPEVSYTEITEDLLSYNAYDDYSTTNNPNRVWSYQYFNGTTYTNLTTDGTRWGSNAEGKIQLTSSDLVTGRKAMYIYATKSTKDIVLAFTAPNSGRINVSMANGGVFAPEADKDKGLTFTLKQGDTVIREKTDLDVSTSTNANRYFNDTVELSVKSGDIVRFIVHRNSTTQTPKVFFNPSIEYVEYTNLAEFCTYNAYNEYSTAGNPNGVWSYQYLSNGTYTNLETDGTRWGSNAEGKIQQGQDTVYSGKYAMYVYAPKTDKDMVLVFNAPYSGNINISMPNNVGVIAPSAEGSGLTFTLKQNDTVIRQKTDLDKTTNPIASRYFMDTVNLNVKKGEKIRFIIHKNSGESNPKVYFNPEISYTSFNVDVNEETVYYISSTDGSDTNAGITAAAPWKSLSKIADIDLGENVKVLLKAGDVFEETLILNNINGTKDNPAFIGAYGDTLTNGLPCINPGIVDDNSTAKLEIAAPCLKITNANGIVIDSIKFTGSGVGIHLDYDNTYNNEYVKINNCEFKDLTGFDIRDFRGTSDRSNGLNISGVYHMATAICASMKSYNIGITDPALIGLYIENCKTDNCGTLYAPAGTVLNTNESGSTTLNGLYVKNCTMKDNDYYGIYVAAIEGGYITDCVIDGCGAGENFIPGTAGILLSTNDFAVINTEIKNQQRGGRNYDGVGIDFEHLCNNVQVRNCYIHDNGGAGILFYDSNAGTTHANNNCSVTNNLFVNNATESNYVDNDPCADIRIHSGTGYALTNGSITGNKYYNSKPRYSFVSNFNDNSYDANTTIENNTKLDAVSSQYIEDKSVVLTYVESVLGNYNNSEYTVNNTVGSDTPEYAVGGSIVYKHSEDFTNPDRSGSVWTYKYYTTENGFEDMTWNSINNRWQYGNTSALITATGMHPHSEGQTVLAFTAPMSGRIRISTEDVIKVSASSTDGTYITVLDKDLNTIGQPVKVTANKNEAYAETYYNVQEGDVIYFCLSKCETPISDMTTINPVVEYLLNDLHIDGTINILDLVRMKKILASEQLDNIADYNFDNKVDSVDIIILRKYLLGVYSY